MVSINDAPVISLPTAPTIDEDEAYTFSPDLTNGITLNDVDVGESPLTLELSVNDGSLTLNTTQEDLNYLINEGEDESSFMILQGTLTNLNNLLDGLIFTPDPNFNGTSTLTLIANDLGASGDGGAHETEVDLEITVTAQNDAPTLTLPDAPTITEDSSITFSGELGNAIILLDDASESETDNDIQLTLTVQYGILSLDIDDNSDLIESGENHSTTITLLGTPEAITNALDGLTYNPEENANSLTMDGPEELQFEINDFGSNGEGDAEEVSETLDITVEAINDSPTLTAPSAVSTDEDTEFLFLLGNDGNLISVSDDATDDVLMIEVQLSCSFGTLTLANPSGVSPVANADGELPDLEEGHSTMTILGTVLNINNALNGLSFKPDENFNGQAQIDIIVDDKGNAGAGEALTVTKTIVVTVVALNDTPTIAVPGDQTTEEDLPITFTSISVADADVGEGAGDLLLELSVNFGALSLGAIGDGLSIEGEDHSSSMVLTGTPDLINDALAGLLYTPNLDYNGDDTLTLQISDLGDTGEGGEKTNSATIPISITSINDAPVHHLPNMRSIPEDHNLTFSTDTANLFYISDDAPESDTDIQVELEVENGILTLADAADEEYVIEFINSSQDGTSSFTIVGKLDHINKAMDGLIYSPNEDFFGDVTLTITSSDNGGTGSGEPLTVTDTFSITVQPVNDAPVNTLPEIQNTNEDSVLTFNTNNQNAISVYDDASIEALSFNVSLEVTNGFLTLSTTDHLELLGGSLNPDSTIHLSGKMDDINAALSGMTFTPDTNFTGESTLTLTTDDLGNRDDFDSDPLTDTDEIIITVNELNDPPVLTFPTALLTSLEDADFTFTEATGRKISVTDPDTYGFGGTLKLTLSVDHGTLKVPDDLGGLPIISGSNGSSAMVVLDTPENLTLSLEGLVYTPPSDFLDTATISLTADDQGNSGTGDSLTATGEIKIFHAPSNDVPLLTVPSSQTIDEDGEWILSGSVIEVVDDANEADILKVEAIAVDGTLKLTAADSGVTVTEDGSAGTLAFSGTLDQINNAFDGFTFYPASNFAGETSISLTVDDQGAGGAGGAMTAAATLQVTVNAVNDAPTISLPGLQTVDLGSTLKLSTLTGNGIAIADIDAADDSTIQVSLEAAEGMLTLSGTSVDFVSGDGIVDESLVFTTTLANANAVLNGMIYTPIQTPSISTQVQITVNDLGNTGSGNPGEAVDTLNISIDHKAPEITQGESITATVDEDDASTFTLPAITATDPTDEELTWDLHSHALKGVATVSGTGSSPTVSYTPNADFNGEDSFIIKVTDTSENIDTITVNVTVASVNDIPVITSTPMTATSEQSYSYTITASDADGDVLSFNATTLPSWLSLRDNDDGTATLSGELVGESGANGQTLDDAEAVAEGSPWKYSEWFGVFKEDSSGWLYHSNLGWLFVPDMSSSSIWFWSDKLGWVWTAGSGYHHVVVSVSDGSDSTEQSFTLATSGTFPSLYSAEASTWLYFETASSPAQFYNYASGKWVESIYNYSVNVSVSSGGMVLGQGSYEKGQTTTLTATPDAGYKFVGWTGDYVSSDPSLTISVTREFNVSANFEELDATDYLDLFD